jgi:hypothetical protein
MARGPARAWRPLRQGAWRAANCNGCPLRHQAPRGAGWQRDWRAAGPKPRAGAAGCEQPAQAGRLGGGGDRRPSRAVPAMSATNSGIWAQAIPVGGRAQ